MMESSNSNNRTLVVNLDNLEELKLKDDAEMNQQGDIETGSFASDDPYDHDDEDEDELEDEDLLGKSGRHTRSDTSYGASTRSQVTDHHNIHNHKKEAVTATTDFKTKLIKEALICLYVLQTVGITVLVYFLADAAAAQQHDATSTSTTMTDAADQAEEDLVRIPPLVITMIVASIGSIVAGLAVAYHGLLMNHIQRLERSAHESRAIVSSLFPAQFGQRLLEERASVTIGQNQNHLPNLSSAAAAAAPTTTTAVKSTAATAVSSPTGTTNSSVTEEDTSTSRTGAGGAAIMLPKALLKSFLSNIHLDSATYHTIRSSAAGGGKSSSSSPSFSSSAAAAQLSSSTSPIADLFPHCTVLFADIVGFTAWSSSREPGQTFELLESLYKTFDRTAHSLRVFKVETIGDCYLAVTGLPDPQPDHATRMVKFARAIMKQMSHVVKGLECVLGPDTGDLSLRIGLNSGPVTAGILRGERSRFQLFGDTVNTASRMESTGEKNRIQLSQSTADLVIASGKENWLVPRQELVDAKGKGQLVTFWALTRMSRNNATESLASVVTGSGSHDTRGGGFGKTTDIGWGDAGGAGAGTGDASSQGENLKLTCPSMSRSARNKRLVDWNVEMLTTQLKRIVAQRDPAANQQAIEDPNAVLKKQGDTPYEEVKEALVLTQFEGNNNVFGDSNRVELNENVVPQLRALLTKIADMYRDNPFHNFEHASHVTLSVHKLLNRVVTPDEVDYEQDLDDIGMDIHNYTYGITSDALAQFAIVFSALIHDVDHPGVSNGRMAEENPELGEKYKGRSVAEQNSVDLAWDLLMQPEYKDLQQCIFTNEDELHRFRSTIINCILATDIFEKDAKAFRQQRWDKAFRGCCSNEGEENNLKATIVIEHIIQASDVSHTMQHWNIYQSWNEKLFREMFLAFDEGRSAMDPSQGWYKGELWFYDNYVIPLAKKLAECKVFGVSSDEYLNHAVLNRQEWAIKGEQVVKEMVERYQKRKEMEIGGFTNNEISSFTPADLEYIMKKLIEKGRSNGTNRIDKDKGQNDAAQAWMDALEVYERAPAALEMRDRSIVFPVYSGIHVWLKGGKIQNDKNRHFEQNLARKFVKESKMYRRKDVVHYIRAMGMLCEVTAVTGNYKTAFALLEDLKSVYNTAKHSRAVEKIYGVDRAATAIAMSAMWYDEMHEMEKALEVCDYVIDEIVPLLDPTNTLGMFELLIPMLKVLHRHGHTKRCYDIFNEHVHEAFLKNHGPDAFTPSKSLHQPIVWLFAMKHDPDGFADFEKIVDWLLVKENGPPNDFLDNIVIQTSWGPSDMAAELCLLVAQRLEREGRGDTDACLTIATKGLDLARAADDKIRNKEGKVLCQFAYTNHAPVMEELEGLAMGLGVYTKAPPLTDIAPSVMVNLPPSYLVAPTDAAEFVES